VEAKQSLMLRDGDRLIDAAFSVAVTGPQAFEIVLESSGGSGGGKKAKNSEYRHGLMELLRRCAPIAQTLDDCQVVSKPAMALPESERRVSPTGGFAYPITLTSTTDFESLTNALTTPQTRIASSAQSGGNPRKRLMLEFTSQQSGLTETEVVYALDAAPAQVVEVRRKDIADGVEPEHVDAALAEWQNIGPDAFHAKYGTKKAHKFVIADANGREYDAKAILIGARFVAGLDGDSADFDGDRRTVLEPLEKLGYVVDDITREDSGRPTQGAASDAADLEQRIQRAQEFVGATDASVERRVRREQRLLREALGLGLGSHPCSLCGRTYPDRLLIAAHIKKRSQCTDEERIDIPAIAMIACAFGCDALFEHGYVVVNEQGLIEATPWSESDRHLHEMVMALVGRSVTNLNPDSLPYFEWHKTNALKPKA